MDKVIDVEIYGHVYKIRVKGDEDEKYIAHLTSYVDQKMHEIAVKSKSADALKIAVLALLNIADDYFVSQKKLDELDAEIGRLEADLESLEARLFKDDHESAPLDESAS
jgi:cell division protein ZapA